MARPRVILKRRRAVRNIHKITRTMQLIATSRFQRAHARLAVARPYMDKLGDLFQELWRLSGGEIRHPLMEARPVRTDLLLVLTSNRGLCGAYNAAVLRTAAGHYRAQQAAGRQVRLEVAGKKGILHMKFLGWPIEAAHTDIVDRADRGSVERLAESYRRLFAVERAVDSVHVACMRFISSSIQRPTVAQLLPMTRAQETDRPAVPSHRIRGANLERIDYDFCPGLAELIEDLAPRAVSMKLFELINDAAVSEQVARMTAMKAATQNAEDMIRRLTQRYNRARQYQITKELSEIIGGAEALE